MSEGNDNLIEGERHKNIIPPSFKIEDIKPFHPSGNVEDSINSEEVQGDKIIPFPKPQDKKPVA
jgi:hypothetical protein